MNLVIEKIDAGIYLKSPKPLYLKVLKLESEQLFVGCFLDPDKGLVTDILQDFYFRSNFTNLNVQFKRLSEFGDFDKLDLSDPVTKEYFETAKKMLTPKTEIGLKLDDFVAIFQSFSESGISQKDQIPDFLDKLGYKLKEG